MASRDDFLHIRVSQSEKSRIESKADQADQSVSAYVRQSALDQSIRPVPEVNREVWSDLSRGLANLNQLARHANEGNVVEIEPDDFQAMREQIQQLRQELTGS